jgi:hypothetical protein
LVFDAFGLLLLIGSHAELDLIGERAIELSDDE